MAEVLTIECDRCHRPVALVRSLSEQRQPREVLRPADRKRLRVEAAEAGSVRDVSSDERARYRLACVARKHRPEVRTFTEDTLERAYEAAPGRVSMRGVTSPRG